MPVFKGARLPMDNQKAGMIPGLHGRLGNQLLRQKVIKV
jgi:hypothetical protein